MTDTMRALEAIGWAMAVIVALYVGRVWIGGI